jgi:hypothetical protein
MKSLSDFGRNLHMLRKWETLLLFAALHNGQTRIRVRSGLALELDDGVLLSRNLVVPVF